MLWRVSKFCEVFVFINVNTSFVSDVNIVYVSVLTRDVHACASCLLTGLVHILEVFVLFTFLPFNYLIYIYVHVWALNYPNKCKILYFEGILPNNPYAHAQNTLLLKKDAGKSIEFCTELNEFISLKCNSIYVPPDVSTEYSDTYSAHSTITVMELNYIHLFWLNFYCHGLWRSVVLSRMHPILFVNLKLSCENPFLR